MGELLGHKPIEEYLPKKAREKLIYVYPDLRIDSKPYEP